MSGAVVLLAFTAQAGEIPLTNRALIGNLQSSNPIVRENRRHGTKALHTVQSNAPDRTIEGYPSEPSVAPGELLQLHVSTEPEARFRARIFRLGFYANLGARLMKCLPTCRKTLQGRAQPMDAPDPATGRVKENWPVTESFRIPRDWVSGYYIAQLLLTNGPNAGHYSNVPIIVRRVAAPASKILVIDPVNTDQAYNSWGGKSLYKFNSTGGIAANRVSFDRPYVARSYPYFFELHLVKLLEQYGFDVSYETDVDVQRNPDELLRHRLVIVHGHSEYWSRVMRDALEATRDRGINLSFLGGNTGDWQIRYEDGEHTIVGYKRDPDPYPDPREKTTNFSKLSPPRPQCQLLGAQFGGDFGPIRQYGVTTAALSDPWFNGTNFKAGDTFVGNNFEYDVSAPDCLGRPMITFFADAARPNIAPALRYVAPSGAKVFSVNSFALEGVALADPRVRRFARNAISALSS